MSACGGSVRSRSTLVVDGKEFSYYSLDSLNDPRVGLCFFFCFVFFLNSSSSFQSLETLPYCIRVLLECAVRNCDEYRFTSKHIETILNWSETQGVQEIPFLPSRVILQDFTFVFFFFFFLFFYLLLSSSIFNSFS
jgi:hypothetical protein